MLVIAYGVLYVKHPIVL